jgi:hypothetical protein
MYGLCDYFRRGRPRIGISGADTVELFQHGGELSTGGLGSPVNGGGNESQQSV